MALETYLKVAPVIFLVAALLLLAVPTVSDWQNRLMTRINSSSNPLPNDPPRPITDLPPKEKERRQRLKDKVATLPIEYQNSFWDITNYMLMRQDRHQGAGGGVHRLRQDATKRAASPARHSVSVTSSTPWSRTAI